METGISLSGIERQDHILRLLEHQQRLTVARICEEFSVSEATARRDLEILAEQGKLQRVHGGAILPLQAPPELPILQRENERTEEKQRIGRLAAEMVAEGETIFLGSGTTVLAVARNLRNRRNLTVITNSLPVVNVLADLPDITLVSLGGILRRSEFSFIGHITEQSISEVRADKAIIGTRAINLEQGLTNDYLPETMTDRAILRSAREVIVVADYTKCGRVSTAFLAPLAFIHKLVTNQQSPPDFVAALRDQGIEVILS